MADDIKYKTKPDGFMPDGTPVYIHAARGVSKSGLQLEVCRKLCGISDEEWITMKQIVAERLGFVNEIEEVK